jgi:hypothetical protein
LTKSAANQSDSRTRKWAWLCGFSGVAMTRSYWVGYESLILYHLTVVYSILSGEMICRK